MSPAGPGIVRSSRRVDERLTEHATRFHHRPHLRDHVALRVEAVNDSCIRAAVAAFSARTSSTNGSSSGSISGMRVAKGTQRRKARQMPLLRSRALGSRFGRREEGDPCEGSSTTASRPRSSRDSSSARRARARWSSRSSPRACATATCRSCRASTPWPVPAVCGHEGAGIVAEVGEAVTHVKPGDHVIIATLAACGFCEQCNNGRPTSCRQTLGNASEIFTLDGKGVSNFAAASVFADRTVVRDVQVVPDPRRRPAHVGRAGGLRRRHRHGRGAQPGQRASSGRPPRSSASAASAST